MAIFEKELYNYIRTTFTFTGDFRYITAEGSTPPYFIIVKASADELPNTLCQTQGETGKALFRISGYAGGQDGAITDAAATMEYMEAIKVQFAELKGEIGTSPNDFRIWNNVTSGVTPLGESERATWGAVFDFELWWEKI